MLWTVIFTLPLMVAIQIVSARIGYVTQRGLAANIKAGFAREVLLAVVDPRELIAAKGHDVLLMVVAVFGTTISPYLFFWQAGQEVEDAQAAGEAAHTAFEVRHHLRRIKLDTVAGMTISNLIAFFIILSTAATLHASGVREIQTSAQAAALTP